MGWEKRGQGSYYYRKVRRGGRVVSQYVGRGEVAELASRLDDVSKRERLREQLAQRINSQEIRAKAKRIDAAVFEFEKLARAILCEHMIAQGYHLHKGQWRRRRG